MLDFGFYNMDCMEGMKQFPDKFFDLAIVDPPYGIGIDGQKMSINKNPKHNRKEHIKKQWDEKIPDFGKIGIKQATKKLPYLAFKELDEHILEKADERRYK